MFAYSVYADDWFENLNINSFFSIDATVSDHEISLVSTSEETRHYSPDKVNFKNTIIGSQFDLQLTNNLTGFIQGAIFYNDKDDIDTSIDWAYLSYDWGDDIVTRFGKLQIPFLHGTELRKVGYARLWARPLIPSNGASGYQEYIGAEILKSFSHDDNYWTFQLSIGKPEHGLDLIKGKQMALFSAAYRNNNFWLRTAIMHSKYAISTENDLLLSDNSNIRMVSIEAQYTISNLITNIGYSTSRSDLTPNDTMSYISSAYQLDTISPYIFFARNNQHFDSTQPFPPLPPVGTSPIITPEPNGDSDKDNIGIGIKWDFTNNLLIKAQFENVKFRDNTRIRLGLIENESKVLSLLIEGVY